MARGQDRVGKGGVPRAALGETKPFLCSSISSGRNSNRCWGPPRLTNPPFSLSLSKLTRESGTDFPIPAVPPGTDPETERLIREKDEEVRVV